MQTDPQQYPSAFTTAWKSEECDGIDLLTTLWFSQSSSPQILPAHSHHWYILNPKITILEPKCVYFLILKTVARPRVGSTLPTYCFNITPYWLVLELSILSSKQLHCLPWSLLSMVVTYAAVSLVTKVYVVDDENTITPMFESLQS